MTTTKIHYKNGDYEGTVNAAQQPHGQGTITFNSKNIVYNGDWRNGLCHGQGKTSEQQPSTATTTTATSSTAITSNLKVITNNIHEGGEYDGEWNRNHMHGNGTYVFKNGDVYEGEWRLSKMHGHGRYVWKVSGDEYVGQFACGVREGQGTYDYKKAGVKYIGYWLNDDRHGPGTEIYPTQNRFEGNWVDGKKNGVGYYYVHKDNIKEEKKKNAVTDYLIFERNYEHGVKTSEVELNPLEANPSIDVTAHELIQAEKDFTNMNMNNVFVRYLVYGSTPFGMNTEEVNFEQMFIKFEKLKALKKMRERREKAKNLSVELFNNRSSILEKAQKLEDIKRDGTKQEMAAALRDICNTDPPSDGMMEDIFRMKLSVQIQKLNEQMATLDRDIELEESKTGKEVDGPESNTEWDSVSFDPLYSLYESIIETGTKRNEQIEEDIKANKFPENQYSSLIQFDLDDIFNDLVKLVCDFLNHLVCYVRSLFTPAEAKKRDLQSDLNQFAEELKQLTGHFSAVKPEDILQRMQSLISKSSTPIHSL